MVLRRIMLISLIVLFVGPYGTSQQVEIKRVPINYISPADGEKMYLTYCAACHGTDGRGTGPAASALKSAPTNLSVLAKLNNGKYPDMHVKQVILGDAQTSPAHGSKDMPVWRGLFYSLCRGTNMEEAEAHQRAVNLAKYVGSLQR